MLTCSVFLEAAITCSHAVAVCVSEEWFSQLTELAGWRGSLTLPTYSPAVTARGGNSSYNGVSGARLTALGKRFTNINNDSRLHAMYGTYLVLFSTSN